MGLTLRPNKPGYEDRLAHAYPKSDTLQLVTYKMTSPLTIELYSLEVLFRLVTPFFTCISTSAVSYPWKLEPQLLPHVLYQVHDLDHTHSL